MANEIEGPLIVAVSAWVAFLASLAASRMLSRSKLLPDHPNHRSSHDHVTSKAGGLAIIGAWLAGLFVVGVYSGLPETGAATVKLALLGIGAMLVGAADDKWDITPWAKFSAQIALAIFFMLAFSALTRAPLPAIGLVSLGWAGVPITLFWFVAFMNAFNFMDGSNGLAAGSALVGLCGFCMVSGLAGEPFLAAVSLLLAVTIFGFLPSNLKRGKLFMGDNGSQAVGFIIAALALLGSNWSNGAVSALFIPVVFFPFLFDVAFTLTHRLMRKQNILAAHREHLYQLMLRLGASHAKVAIIYMVLTAISVGVATLMLAAPPALQWIMPAMLTVIFGVGAWRIVSRAKAAGMVFETAGRTEKAVVGSPALDAENSKGA